MLSIRWAHLLRRLILLLGVYFLLRLLFFFCNHHLFAGLGFGRIAEAFGYGLRFDFSALVAINFPFIVLTFLPPALEPRPAYERLLKGVFLLLNVPFLVINIIDLEYFHFTGRRSTLQLLGVAGDAGVKFSTLALYYWPLVLLGLFLVALVFVLYGRSPVAAARARRGRTRTRTSRSPRTRRGIRRPLNRKRLTSSLRAALRCAGRSAGTDIPPSAPGSPSTCSSSGRTWRRR